MQVRVSEFNQQKSQLSQIARKQTGSLAVRDLSKLVSEGDVVNTENLTTLFVVVPRHVKKEWLSTYETLTEYVVSSSCPPTSKDIVHWLCRIQKPMTLCLQVPRSSKQIQEDTDYTLFSVSLFRRIADTFKAEARQRGFQVCVTLMLASHFPAAEGIYIRSSQWYDAGAGVRVRCTDAGFAREVSRETQD